MTAKTDTAALATIQAASRDLKLPMVRADAERIATDAQRSKLSYLAFLADVLAAEVDQRAERRRQRRIHEARFPRIKRLADFDLDAAPTINPATIATLAGGNYLSAGDPIVLLGDSGTGKSHLLIGFGLAACEQGHRVRYITAAQLTNELAEAADERRLSRVVARYGRLDLLCLDELGYVQLDSRGSELLFQILTEREEKSSVAVASNLPFSEWAQVIPDPRLVSAVIDRLTFNAHIIETGTTSYRLRTTRTRRTHGAKTNEHTGANPA
jgi:DNA replication protein DnaC